MDSPNTSRPDIFARNPTWDRSLLSDVTVLKKEQTKRPSLSPNETHRSSKPFSERKSFFQSGHEIDEATQTVGMTFENGMVARVDLEDWPKIKDRIWKIRLKSDGKSKNWNRWYVNEARVKTYNQMHRFVMSPAPEQMVDHINGDGLDNRKANLRYSTNALNQQNRKPKVNTSSAFKGATWNRQKNRWKVAFRCNGKFNFVGCFQSEVEAARAYNDRIYSLIGDYAMVNELPDEMMDELMDKLPDQSPKSTLPILVSPNSTPPNRQLTMFA